ncbi:hypothetical protein ACFWP5_07850 [Streptomyces sp. NPDC058469]|uniref:hypothetical protein n=1 Tax=Streptomyces sp. NPDC058469 TaxID=3346514 RepID=UPI00366342ED
MHVLTGDGRRLADQAAALGGGQLVPVVVLFGTVAGVMSFVSGLVPVCRMCC